MSDFRCQGSGVSSQLSDVSCVVLGMEDSFSTSIVAHVGVIICNSSIRRSAHKMLTNGANVQARVPLLKIEKWHSIFGEAEVKIFESHVSNARDG